MGKMTAKTKFKIKYGLLLAIGTAMTVYNISLLAKLAELPPEKYDTYLRALGSFLIAGCIVRAWYRLVSHTWLRWQQLKGRESAIAQGRCGWCQKPVVALMLDCPGCGSSYDEHPLDCE